MENLQRMGGVAALVQAATFIVGFALFLSVLEPSGYLDMDTPGESVTFLVDNQAIMYTWNVIIYLIFGIFLVVLTLALYERLNAHAPVLARIASVFGLIWAGLVIAAGMVANVGHSAVVELHATDPAQAEALWLTVRTVEFGLGGGNEIAGGLWILLLSLAALRAEALPRVLNYLGVVIGAAALLTVVPALEMLGVVFGLGSIVWFVWLGISLVRDK